MVRSRAAVLATALLALSSLTLSACGDDDASSAGDPAEFCRLNASIAAEATEAGSSSGLASVLAVFARRMPDIDRQEVLAPPELAQPVAALVTATRTAVETDSIAALLADGPAQTARDTIERYCAAQPARS